MCSLFLSPMCDINNVPSKILSFGQHGELEVIKRWICWISLPGYRGRQGAKPVEIDSLDLNLRPQTVYWFWIVMFLFQKYIYFWIDYIVIHVMCDACHAFSTVYIIILIYFLFKYEYVDSGTGAMGSRAVPALQVIVYCTCTPEFPVTIHEGAVASS